MISGTVKWFNDKKGYGFIIGPDNNEYFVHFSNITIDGYKTLKDGDKVVFNPEQGLKGLEAKDVTPI